MNQIRILASHNSYKMKPTARTFKFLQKLAPFLSEENKPYQLNYGHLTITEQLSFCNLRGLELDVYNDPQGGRYFRHPLNRFIPKQKVKDKRDSLLLSPGFKLLHIPDIDYLSHYQTLEQALIELNAWSLANPTHAPIFVNIELKSSAMGDEAPFLQKLGFKKAVPFGHKALLSLDSLFKANLKTLYWASTFRGSHATFRDRINTEGWPTLSDTRGHVFMVAHGNGSQYYPQRNEGAFLYGDPGHPNTIFTFQDNTLGVETETQQLTKDYMVRTRSDAGTIEANRNDYSRLNSALKSGAQIISTDFYKIDPSIGTFCIPFVGFLK